jgi:hypothetical protein
VLAGVVAAEGQPERAARLFGAAAALRQSRTAAVANEYRGLYDRVVADVRGRLGDAAFAQAWATGESRSLEQTIREALS